MDLAGSVRLVAQHVRQLLTDESGLIGELAQTRLDLVFQGYFFHVL